MLTAMLLATPLFGLSLAPPDLAVLAVPVSPTTFVSVPTAGEWIPAWNPLIASPLLPQDEWGDEWNDEDGEAPASEQKEDAESRDSQTKADEEGDDSEVATEANVEASIASASAPSKEEYAEQVKTRSSLSDIHRVMGIATWGAMTGTLVLGTIQYYNLYGFGAGIGSNPCVEGTAVFGQDQCSGTPWLHLGGGLLTAGLYSTTFALSLAMPDPNNLAEGKGAFADKLRLHKTLRWVHFAGMIAQMGLGFLIANSEVIGLDRANDYGALQALSTVHLGIGLVTWGAMTWAGALFTF